MNRSRLRSVPPDMRDDRVGCLMEVEALGSGRVPARLERREPMSYHGIPGLACRLTLRLADGRAVEAIQVGPASPAVLDPRFRIAGRWSGAGAARRRYPGEGAEEVSMSEKRAVPNDEERRSRLTPEQYAVTRRAATERAFTGRYWDHHEDGVYRCVVCGEELFESDAKFDSGTGWPSFVTPASDGAVEDRKDLSHGMVRTEVVCTRCESHLGHVFPDGPQPTGLRYCINSASLEFASADEERDS